VPVSYTPVRVTDVTDPIGGGRRDVEFDVPGPSWSAGRSVIDGADLWVLPGLYDADAHLPVLQRGLRAQDRTRAMAGGATAINTALPWHLVEPLDLHEVTAFFAATVWPRVLPILSVADEPSSTGFPAWLDKFGEQIRETWMPTIKLYSNDPNFWPNLEAVWAAGCRAAIYFYDEQAFVDVVASRGGPVHFRHVISSAMYEQVASRPESTSQTSPHFLVQLPPSRPEELFVLPPVESAEDRASLLTVVGDGIDLIASDHNAPVAGSTGPGLESAQHLLPALLTLAGTGVLDLATAIAKASSSAAAVFRPAPALPDTQLLVDPSSPGPAGLWPGQEARRAPFRGVALSGCVLAAVAGGQGRFL
jgi:dihydroorotase-like cyclic amidohydrolase